jgi:hypothetical protein
MQGVKEPVWYRGEQVGSVTRYSDVLLMFLIKGIRPHVYRDNYRDKEQVQQDAEAMAKAIREAVAGMTQTVPPIPAPESEDE